MEKKILFVDDQWCEGRGQDVIVGAYGNLLDRGYDFIFETAKNGSGYSFLPVMNRIKEENPDAMVLDMDFGDQQGYGETILREVKSIYTSLPVIIHSSASDQGLMDRCSNLGAEEWLVKKASESQLEGVLNKYISER
tara:strand:+ start:1194 stop:1604 length:411 start_codon:yes stop_codon:yes gene_type:complete